MGNPMLVASDRTVERLATVVQPDGSFGADAREMTCYHKSAYLFGLAGRNAEANRMLSFIKRRYLRPDGDFMLDATHKRDKVDYNEITWGYSNGWFALAAHRLGRFDISWPAYRYLQSHFHQGTGGYTMTRPSDPRHPIIELLATAHVGMLALYLGDQEKALAAAALARRFVDVQSGAIPVLYLCMNAAGDLIRDYPEEQAPYYALDLTRPGQFYFTVGYAAAFLANVHLVTGEKSHLDAARRYIEVGTSATGVYDTHFSHKLAWGASLLYRITREEKYEDIALRITKVMLGMQGADGLWFGDQPPHIAYDQSAECAIWLRTIPAELGA